jgi:hypothetical protein
MTEKKTQRARPLGVADLTSGDRVARATTSQQCTATSKRTGERCRAWALRGARTCRVHGSATKKSKVAAAKRIADASGFAADMLVEFMADPKVDVKLRTQIAQDLLNRGGYTSKQSLELEVRDYRDVMEGVLIDIDDEDTEDAVIVLEPPRAIDAGAEARRDSEIEEREAARRRKQRLGRSGDLPPTETARREGRMSSEDRRKHEAFLMKRLGVEQPGKPARKRRVR